MQIAAYCVSALAGGTMFFLWRRMDEDDRRRVWRLYGWFSGLMMCGSCFGAVAWAARMMYQVNLSAGLVAVQKRVQDAEGYSYLASFCSWRAAFIVTYTFELLCLTAAKLMVLDRMSDFAAPQGDGARKRWAAGGRIVMAFVVLGNAAGLASAIAAAVYFQKTSEYWSTSAAYYAAGNQAGGFQYNLFARDHGEDAFAVLAYQSVFEVAVLLLIVAAFVVVGLMCARRVSLRMMAVGRASAAAAGGSTIRLQMVATTSVVFLSFLLRSAVSTMLAVANKLQDGASTKCPQTLNLCNASCYNMYTNLVQWNVFTPEFQSTVVLIASPITLLVALWGMTTKLTTQLMTSGRSGAAHSMLRTTVNR